MKFSKIASFTYILIRIITHQPSIYYLLCVKKCYGFFAKKLSISAKLGERLAILKHKSRIFMHKNTTSSNPGIEFRRKIT
jgi:hypothetical protein